MIKQKRACSKSISPAPDTELHPLRALRIASSTPSLGDIGSFGPSRIHPRHYVWYQYTHSDTLVGLRASVKPKSTSQAFGIHRETPYEPIVSPQSLSGANTPTDYTSCMTAWSFRAIIAAIPCHDWWPPSLNHGLWSTKAYVGSSYMSRSTSRGLLPVRNRAIDTMCGRSRLEYYLPLPFRQSETLCNWQLSKSRATDNPGFVRRIRSIRELHCAACRPLCTFTNTTATGYEHKPLNTERFHGANRTLAECGLKSQSIATGLLVLFISDPGQAIHHCGRHYE